jgi:hypothetical protein
MNHLLDLISKIKPSVLGSKIYKKENIMIATLNKSKTALTINRQEFKLALEKIGAGIDKQISALKKAKQSYDPAEIAREVIGEVNIFEAIIEGFNEEEGSSLKLADITNIEVAQGWIDDFLGKYSKPQA